MVTTLEDLSVELFYEIFVYFQLHEIWNIFSNLNSRITFIIENLPSISVYLGCRGMTIEMTDFYYKYLSQTNICTRLTSLCVSDAFSFDNGLWFAKHGSIFINLRHLSLIDIKSSAFEMILNSLSPIDSLLMFSVHIVSADDRGAYNFEPAPSGAYHEQIFRLFPSLRVCHLLLGRYQRYTKQFVVIPSVNQRFVSVQSTVLNLQSLTLRYCLPQTFSHLFEYLPQLKQFSCYFYNNSPMYQQCPLSSSNNQCFPINKRLAPNLRHLKLNWVEMMIDMKSIEMLFGCDVLFSLTNFTLLGQISDLNVLQNVLSKLSSQCLYRYDVMWDVTDDEVSLLDTSNILSKTFEQLKGRVPIELELSLVGLCDFMRAMTLPRMDVFFCVDMYVRKGIVQGQSRWPSNKHALNNRWLCSNTIVMSDRYDQTNGEFLSLSPNIICWDRITTIYVLQPFNSTYLYVLFSQTINLRILAVQYIPQSSRENYLREKILIDFINDQSLCNILMSNGLRQLNLFTGLGQRDLIDLANLIVERLPYLEAIELNCDQIEVIEMASIFIDGLFKLSFVALCGCLEIFIHQNKIALSNSNARPFRMEMSWADKQEALLIWL